MAGGVALPDYYVPAAVAPIVPCVECGRRIFASFRPPRCLDCRIGTGRRWKPPAPKPPPEPPAPEPPDVGGLLALLGALYRAPWPCFPPRGPARDDALRRAHEGGETLRSIAWRADVSHEAVRQAIKRSRARTAGC